MPSTNHPSMYNAIGEVFVPAPTDVIVSEAERKDGTTTVVYHHVNGLYSVVDADLLRHPNLDECGVIRCLSHYLNGK